MKYSLSYRVSPKYLAKADEIRIPLKAIERVGEFAEKYPNADLLLDIGFEMPIDEIETAITLARGKLIVRTANLDVVPANVPYIWTFSPKDLYELNALQSLKVHDIQINNALFFQVDKLKHLPLRFNPTEATTQAILPNINTIVSPYMRPEDQKLYEDRIDILELSAETPEKEEALFRIYAEEGEWPGQLDAIIPIETDAINRMIPPEFGKMRYNCGLGCLRGTKCQSCYRYLKMADLDLIKDYTNSMKQD